MERYYSEYTNWEDYINGMYRCDLDNECSMIELSLSLLIDSEKFYRSCKKVLNDWKISTAVNLTNKSINRIAWLGQAACCIEFGCNEKSTKIAWSKMNTEQRVMANKIAKVFVNEFDNTWKQRLRELLKNGKQSAIKMEYQMKLPFDWKN